MAWVLFLWLVTADHTLQLISTETFNSEQECIAVLIDTMSEEVNWIATCKPVKVTAEI